MYELVKDLNLTSDELKLVGSFIKNRGLNVEFGYKKVKVGGQASRVRTLALKDIKIISERIEQGIRDKESFSFNASGGILSVGKKLKKIIEETKY